MVCKTCKEEIHKRISEIDVLIISYKNANPYGKFEKKQVELLAWAITELEDLTDA